MLEFIHTSVPKGLRSGTSGFCPVAWTEGLPVNWIAPLEQLCGYKAIWAPNEPGAEKNPIVWSFQRLLIAGKPQTVLSRIGACGLDYTGRSNKIAHHLLLDPSECRAGGSGIYFAARDNFTAQWEGEPKLLPIRHLKSHEVELHKALMWESYAGDAGWAGVVCDAFAANPEKPFWVIFEPGMDLLPLVLEALAILEPAERWRFSFNTYFVTLPAGGKCFLRFCPAGSDAHMAAKRIPGAMILDLTPGAVRQPCPDSPAVQTARSGQRPVMTEIREMQPLPDPTLLPIQQISAVHNPKIMIQTKSDPSFPPAKKAVSSFSRWFWTFLLFLFLLLGAGLYFLIGTPPETPPPDPLPPSPKITILEIDEPPPISEPERDATRLLADAAVKAEQAWNQRIQEIIPSKSDSEREIPAKKPLISKPVVSVPITKQEQVPQTDWLSVQRQLWHSWTKDFSKSRIAKLPALTGHEKIAGVEFCETLRGRRWDFKEPIWKNNGKSLEFYPFAEVANGLGTNDFHYWAKPSATLLIEGQTFTWTRYFSVEKETREKGYIVPIPADIRAICFENAPKLYTAAADIGEAEFLAMFTEISVKVDDESQEVILSPADDVEITAYVKGFIFYQIDSEIIDVEKIPLNGNKIISGNFLKNRFVKRNALTVMVKQLEEEETQQRLLSDSLSVELKNLRKYENEAQSKDENTRQAGQKKCHAAVIAFSRSLNEYNAPLIQALTEQNKTRISMAKIDANKMKIEMLKAENSRYYSGEAMEERLRSLDIERAQNRQQLVKLRERLKQINAALRKVERGFRPGGRP